MRSLRQLPLLLLALPSAAEAEATLLVSAEGDVRVLVDEKAVPNLRAMELAPVALEAGRHGLRVETTAGAMLAERNLELEEGEALWLHWDGGSLRARDPDELRQRHQGSQPSQPTSHGAPSAMSTLQAGSTVARMVAPSNPVVAGVATGITVASAGSTLVRSAQDASQRSARAPQGPSAVSASEDHSLEGLRQSGYDPYAATGGRPSVDASMASVTFVGAPGAGGQGTGAGQQGGPVEAPRGVGTVPVVPGLHKVMIYSADGVTPLHRGYLQSTAGWVLELSYSMEERPVCSLPEAWR